MATMTTPPDIFNFSEWESTFASPAASQPSPSTSISTPLSGEFNSFSFVGKKLAGGVNGAAVKRLLFNAELCGTSVCLGAVGSSRFCIKDCLPNSNSCGIGAHGSKKFNADKSVFYVRESPARALCDSRFVLKSWSNLLSMSQALSLINQGMTMQEWSGSFELMNSGVIPSWLEDEKENDPSYNTEQPVGLESLSSEHVKNQASSPMSAAERAGIVLRVPMLSFDDDDPSGSADSEGDFVSSSTFRQAISVLHDRFRNLKGKWANAFQEVEANYLVLVKDINKLTERTSVMSHQLGQTTSSASVTVWDSLRQVTHSTASSINQVRQNVSSVHTQVNTMLQEQRELRHELQAMPTALDFDSVDERLMIVEDKTLDHNRRFGQVLQFLR